MLCMIKSHTLDSSITVWLLCLCSDILGIVEKSALLTLTPTLYVDPYPHYFICRYLRTNTNMRDQLSTRKLKHLFTTRLDTAREATYTLYVAILLWHLYIAWQHFHLLLVTLYAMVWQGGTRKPLCIGLDGLYGFVMCLSSTYFLKNV